MDISLFIIFFMTALLLCKVFLFLANNYAIQTGKDISNKAGLSVIASVILGWTLLQTATNAPSFPFKEFALGLYPFLIGALALSMYSIKRGSLPRFWIYLFVCLLSVSFLPSDWSVFQGLLPVFFDRCITALLWALFISIYARMDKVENLTQTQTMVLCLSFSIFPALTAKIGRAYPSEFAYYPMIILAPLIAFIKDKRHFPELKLGKTGAVPLGYLMGLFFVFMAVKGFYMAALIMPLYYYFELVYSAIYRWWHRKNPQPVIFSFFLNKIVRTNLNTKGLMSRLFVFMLGFSLIGILFNYNIKKMLTWSSLLLLCSVYMLSRTGVPKITYRSMFKDTKEAIGLLGLNLKDSCQTAADFWKSKKK